MWRNVVQMLVIMFRTGSSFAQLLSSGNFPKTNVCIGIHCNSLRDSIHKVMSQDFCKRASTSVSICGDSQTSLKTVAN